MLQIIIIYFVLINLTTFILRGIDKWKAIDQQRRISEKTLLIFSGIGGFVGGLIGMSIRRHKNIKTKFLMWFYGIVILWIVILIIIGLHS